MKKVDFLEKESLDKHYKEAISSESISNNVKILLCMQKGWSTGIHMTDTIVMEAFNQAIGL